MSHTLMPDSLGLYWLGEGGNEETESADTAMPDGVDEVRDRDCHGACWLPRSDHSSRCQQPRSSHAWRTRA